MSNQEACSHLRVKYIRIEEGGMCRDTWRCELGCGAFFWPSPPEREILKQAHERSGGAEQLYNLVMSLLRQSKMPHGLCEPRERQACTHCNAVDALDKMLEQYKGARIIPLTASAHEVGDKGGRK